MNKEKNKACTKATKNIDKNNSLFDILNICIYLNT